MANIGSTDIYINVPSLPKTEFEKYSTQLFDQWETYVDKTIILPDYSLVLDVEEGSIKALGQVGAVLGALYFGIGQYGSFISGIQTIDRQIRAAGDYLGKAAGKPFIEKEAKPTVRKRSESLARLQRLYLKVQRGELTVEQAMAETEAIFGAEIDDAPGFMDELKTSLKKLPQQVELPFIGMDETEFLLPYKKTKTSRPTKPREPMPPTDQFRVEVWRDSRKAKRNIRVRTL